jgi:hypothetical protein
MNIYDQILSMCVSKDELREELQQPCKRNGHIYSTNGHLICKVDASLVGNEYQQVEMFPKKVQDLIDEAMSNGKKRHGRFAVDAAILVFNQFERIDVYTTKKCTKCDGNGKRYCDACEHWNDCNQCDGDGEIRTSSKPIGKSFASASPALRVGKNIYNAEYVEWLTEFAKLQDETEIVMVAQPEESKAMGTLFRIGKVEILLMPMRSEGVECLHEIGLKP